MGGLANVTEKNMLNHVLKASVYNIYSSINVGLSTTDVGEDGSGISEPSGNGYSRVTHNSWVPSVTGTISNNGDIQFPEATGSWGSIGHYFITDDSGSTLIGYGSLTNPNDINSGDTITFKSGQLSLWFDLDGSSEYISDKILNMVFLSSYYDTTSDIYVGLSTSDPGDDGSGINEPDSTSTNYTRIIHNNWNEVNVVQDIITSWNVGAIAFPEATAAWGVSITHAFLTDDKDNLLFYGELSSPVTIQQGDTPIFRDGGITIRLE